MSKKETRTKTGTCAVCGINLYKETDNKPSPDAMPCNINRTFLTDDDINDIKSKFKIINEGGELLKIELVACPYETAEEQVKNSIKYNFEPAGLGEIMYEGDGGI